MPCNYYQVAWMGNLRLSNVWFPLGEYANHVCVNKAENQFPNIFEHILCLFTTSTHNSMHPFNQPKFFRQLLFTPQKPKEDDLKIKMDSLVEEIAECKKLAEDGQARYEKLQRDFDMQIKLMQKLLKNSSL